MLSDYFLKIRINVGLGFKIPQRDAVYLVIIVPIAEQLIYAVAYET